MRIFFSAGEASGDIHGSNLITELHRQDPTIVCEGFGGDRMAASGCRLHFQLTQLAVMGFSRVFAHATSFLKLLSQADRYFRHHRPDAVVLIDFPGFNWWIARRAHFHKIPVYYFVPPQIWAWASYRVKKMRRFVDHVLCSLPFEEAWFQERGVQAHYIGHPFFDEVRRQHLDQTFLAQQRSQGRPIVAILPGSRNQEVERNLSTLARTAQRVHQVRPDCRFLVANFKPHHQALVENYLARHPGIPLETFVGRTPEIIALADCCVTVSGSVSLELLNRAIPTTVVYRTSAWEFKLARYLVTVKYITLVNLLAGREIYPEYPTDRCEAEALSGHVLKWLNDPAAAAEMKKDLVELRDKYGSPGACRRAAEYILNSQAKTIPRAG